MSRYIIYLVFSFACLVGCTNNSEETNVPEKMEYYRYTIGATSAAFLTATFHADELVRSKINSGTSTKLDQERVANLLEALKRHKKRFEEMLEQTYKHQDDRERDQEWLPIVQELILATDALNEYLENKNENKLEQYILHRDKFLEKLTRVKQSN